MSGHCLLARISKDADVNDLKHPGAEDYYAVMNEAIEWIRQEVKDLSQKESAHKKFASESTSETRLAA